MDESDDASLLGATRIDIPGDIRTYVVQMLNQTLACTVDLRSHVKQAAWNVRGKDAFNLQALLNALAAELDVYATLVAERLAVLGGRAQGTIRMATAKSTLLEYPSDIVAGRDHVLALVERLAHYARTVRANIMQAADVEDMGTANIYTDISRGIDKRLWDLETYLYP